MTIEELLYWGICHREPPEKKDKIEKRKGMDDIVEKNYERKVLNGTKR